jgi:hypothetical protein
VGAKGWGKRKGLHKREAPSAMRRTPRPSTLSRKATARRGERGEFDLGWGGGLWKRERGRKGKLRRRCGEIRGQEHFATLLLFTKRDWCGDSRPAPTPSKPLSLYRSRVRAILDGTQTLLEAGMYLSSQSVASTFVAIPGVAHRMKQCRRVCEVWQVPGAGEAKGVCVAVVRGAALGESMRAVRASPNETMDASDSAPPLRGRERTPKIRTLTPCFRPCALSCCSRAPIVTTGAHQMRRWMRACRVWLEAAGERQRACIHLFLARLTERDHADQQVGATSLNPNHILLPPRALLCGAYRTRRWTRACGGDWRREGGGKGRIHVCSKRGSPNETMDASV